LVGLGDQGQRFAHEAAGLADPHQAHHQGWEGLWVLAEGGRERHAGFDIGLHRGQRDAQTGILSLFDQDGECPHQRQAGVDQAGELPGEHRQRLQPDPSFAVREELDLLVEPGLRDRRHIQRHQALRAQLGHHGRPAGGFQDALDHPAALGVDGAIGELDQQGHHMLPLRYCA